MRVKVFRRNDAAGAVAHDLENHVNAWLAENSGKVGSLRSLSGLVRLMRR